MACLEGLWRIIDSEGRLWQGSDLGLAQSKQSGSTVGHNPWQSLRQEQQVLQWRRYGIWFLDIQCFVEANSLERSLLGELRLQCQALSLVLTSPTKRTGFPLLIHSDRSASTTDRSGDHELNCNPVKCLHIWPWLPSAQGSHRNRIMKTSTTEKDHSSTSLCRANVTLTFGRPALALGVFGWWGKYRCHGLRWTDQVAVFIIAIAVRIPLS